jgi:hypothetical protein
MTLGLEHQMKQKVDSFIGPKRILPLVFGWSPKKGLITKRGRIILNEMNLTIIYWYVSTYYGDKIRGKDKIRGNHLRGKTLTNHAAYLNYIDNFTKKQRTKNIISDMKSKLNADTF